MLYHHIKLDLYTIKDTNLTLQMQIQLNLHQIISYHLINNSYDDKNGHKFQYI